MDFFDDGPYFFAVFLSSSWVYFKLSHANQTINQLFVFIRVFATPAKQQFENVLKHIPEIHFSICFS